jgi:hypothetical protein
MFDLDVKYTHNHKTGFTFEGLHVALMPDQAVNEHLSLVDGIASLWKLLSALASRAMRAATQVEAAPMRRAKA